MDQRTCNIIMCCKGNTLIFLPEDNPLKGYPQAHQNIAAYMSRECACPIEDYTGSLLENILQEALFDYMNTADRPGADLRNLFTNHGVTEPTMSQRIIVLFQLVQVRETKGGHLMNGFTDELLARSKKDLAKENGTVWTMEDGQMVPVDPDWKGGRHASQA